MLSVLIPVFNFDCSVLIEQLIEQIETQNLPAEVVLYDDCSDPQKVLFLDKFRNNYSFLKIYRGEHNLGFTKVRNHIASLAEFDNLLFMDGDVELVNTNFLKIYLDKIPNAEVCCGGILYKDQKPQDQSLILKWKHGKLREEGRIKEKQNNPWVAFSAANFLIKKSVLQAIPFDEASMGYGYNDTLYGYRLMRNSVNVIHIDNPVYHEGLMSAEKFLNRIEESFRNLSRLEQSDYVEKESFYQFLKVLNTYTQLKKKGLLPVFKVLAKLFRKSFRKTLLKSNDPNLRQLDFYKLFTLVEKRG